MVSLFSAKTETKRSRRPRIFDKQPATRIKMMCCCIDRTMKRGSHPSALFDVLFTQWNLLLSAVNQLKELVLGRRRASLVSLFSELHCLVVIPLLNGILDH